jgi:hypothetical protein
MSSQEDQWTRYLELGYRVKVRQQQNVEDYFQDILVSVRKALEYCDLTIVEIGEVLTHYWPIDPRQVEAAKDCGYLVVEHRHEHCLMIRELPIRIPLRRELEVESVWKAICDQCGSVFTSVRVVDTLFTDNEPV